MIISQSTLKAIQSEIQTCQAGGTPKTLRLLAQELEQLAAIALGRAAELELFQGTPMAPMIQPAVMAPSLTSSYDTPTPVAATPSPVYAATSEVLSSGGTIADSSNLTQDDLDQSVSDLLSGFTNGSETPMITDSELDQSLAALLSDDSSGFMDFSTPAASPQPSPTPTQTPTPATDDSLEQSLADLFGMDVSEWDPSA